MAFSRFSAAQLDGSQVRVSGPVRADAAEEGEVAAFAFALVQGDVVAGGSARASDSGWSGEASAGALTAGEAQGIGVMLLVMPGATPGFHAVTWSEAVTVS